MIVSKLRWGDQFLFPDFCFYFWSIVFGLPVGFCAGSANLLSAFLVDVSSGSRIRWPNHKKGLFRMVVIHSCGLFCWFHVPCVAKILDICTSSSWFHYFCWHVIFLSWWCWCGALCLQASLGLSFLLSLSCFHLILRMKWLCVQLTTRFLSCIQE